MKNLLQTFNTPESLLVITSYPNPINGKYGARDFNAIGEHSERRLPYLAKDRKVLVVAEQMGKNTTFKATPNLMIARVWKKRNILSFFKLFYFILKQNKIRSILVQFEFNVFGGTIPNMIIMALLFLLRFTSKETTFELHQVITDVGTLKKHINITNPIKRAFLNTGLKLFYKTVGFVAKNIVVFEQEIKERLSAYVTASKITVLCLSIDRQKAIDQKVARKTLDIKQNEFVILVFGFINGYKGIDWILNALKNVNKQAKGRPVRLLITGGKNPYLKDYTYYQRFYNAIVAETKKYTHVTYSNFVSDEKVGLYFSASDIVALPYEVFMSASGPFSRALAYEKPILLSEKLLNYSKSLDFAQSLADAQLKKSDIFFPLTEKGILSLINKAKKDKKYIQQLATFSRLLGTARSIETVSVKLDHILFSDVKKVVSYTQPALAVA